MAKIIRLVTPAETMASMGLRNMIFPDGIDKEKYSAYLDFMKNQHPHMKPSRLQRKVAQKFKIKLVD